MSAGTIIMIMPINGFLYKMFSVVLLLILRKTVILSVVCWKPDVTSSLSKISSEHHTDIFRAIWVGWHVTQEESWQKYNGWKRKFLFPGLGLGWDSCDYGWSWSFSYSSFLNPAWRGFLLCVCLSMSVNKISKKILNRIQPIYFIFGESLPCDPGRKPLDFEKKNALG